jgi:hypothetical protein
MECYFQKFFIDLINSQNFYSNIRTSKILLQTLLNLKL